MVVLVYCGVVHILSDLASMLSFTPQFLLYVSRHLLCIVMALPLYFLKGLRMRTTQKIGLAGVFSLAVFVVVFDILRTVFSTVGAQSALWCVLEASVAVIVSCLPVYRSILSHRKQQMDKSSIGLNHQEHLMQNPPSMDSMRNEYANVHNDLTRYNSRGSPNTASALADDCGSLGPPEAAHVSVLR